MLEISPLKYENRVFMILDQTRLPGEEVWIQIDTKEELWNAIRELKVRGAPAIGVAAALGMAVCARRIEADRAEGFLQQYQEISRYIGTSRPTAVNLFWALERMEHCLQDQVSSLHAPWQMHRAVNHENDWNRQREALLRCLEEEALRIREEDVASCRAMGEYGLTLLQPGMGILTHCNAGALATAKYGTCLAPIHLGQERGYHFHVFADETRPLLQGARLTSWELTKAGVNTTLICDNMAATVMKKGWIDAVVVGCDRMAANGDGANKIGTSQVAVLARHFGIPFYMFVPSSTIDFNTPTGDDIEIELRDGKEIYQMWYRRDMAPEGVHTYNPAFDVTDHRFITAVVTEKGIVRPPYHQNLRRCIEEQD